MNSHWDLVSKVFADNYIFYLQEWHDDIVDEDNEDVIIGNSKNMQAAGNAMLRTKISQESEHRWHTCGPADDRDGIVMNARGSAGAGVLLDFGLAMNESELRIYATLLGLEQYETMFGYCSSDFLINSQLAQLQSAPETWKEQQSGWDISNADLPTTLSSIPGMSDFIGELLGYVGYSAARVIVEHGISGLISDPNGMVTCVERLWNTTASTMIEIGKSS